MNAAAKSKGVTRKARKAANIAAQSEALFPLMDVVQKSGRLSGYLRMPGPEIVIGIVCAVGTDTNYFCDQIREALHRVAYNTHPIHLIESLRQLDKWASLPANPLDERYNALMTAGNEFREAMGCHDAFALLAAAKIVAIRTKETGDQFTPDRRTAYLIRSLKDPAEVETLRRIYGRNFFAFGAYSSEAAREKRLEEGIAKTRGNIHSSEFEQTAKELVKRDAAEPHLKFGQNVRKAFPLADFFVNADDPAQLKTSLERIVELIFGNFVHTPSKDEYGMFHAFGASLRSASLGRQVGASICTLTGEIVALGCNDVPKATGGLYWAGDDGDKRDHVLGFDSNDRTKKNLVLDILRRLKKEGWLDADRAATDEQGLVDAALQKDGPLHDAHVTNIIEYGRAVHAEMSAITDAALRGVPTRGGVLYTTTFPCHNCAKHIVAAGIARVVYVEPYPKSFSVMLHNDAISFNSSAENRVPFETFVGIAPRQYLRLFSMGDSVRKKDGDVVKWESASALPRDSESPSTYLLLESESILNLDGRLQSAKLKPVNSPSISA